MDTTTICRGQIIEDRPQSNSNILLLSPHYIHLALIFSNWFVFASPSQNWKGMEGICTLNVLQDKKVWIDSIWKMHGNSVN